MRKGQKILALSLGSLLALSLITACGKNDGNDDTAKVGDDVVASALSATIVSDNLGGGYIAEADTQYKLELKKEVAAITVTAKDKNGEAVSDPDTVAVFDSSTKVLTGKGEGTVSLALKTTAGETISTVNVEVVPAYVTNPGNQYQGKRTDYAENGSLLGETHDPSLIEVEEDGAPMYYIFSTGWNDNTKVGDVMTWGNEIRKSRDMLTWEFVGRTFSAAERQDMLNSEVGEWLYGKNGETDSFTWHNKDSWWAPDIVPAADGGYWLYTCVVDGSSDRDGFPIGSQYFARACIIQCYSPTLEPGSFEYKSVLMQSSILRNASAANEVNGIDPQIIYDKDGGMYMAYGSFGSGNYMLELDPQTGLRKDGQNSWKTHDEIRTYVSEIGTLNNKQNPDADNKIIGWEHPYYGKNISRRNMEAPVIARHDNVTVSDENGVQAEGKTFYYSMHSYNGLADAYMMWGGRSESVWGVYRSVGGGVVYNENITSNSNEGNKYMGAFTWSNKSDGNKEIDIILPGHNDLFTTSSGTSVAAYITRTAAGTNYTGAQFFVQIHQYYLNSLGDIVINPNRYSGEVNRSVSKEELLHYTEGGKFKMVVMNNNNVNQKSVDVVLSEDGKITYNSAEIGTWLMYGEGYIKFDFTNTAAISMLGGSGESVFYGVVRPAWLGDQNKSGFTVTCMGHTGGNRSMAMFMNNYSNITGDTLVG